MFFGSTSRLDFASFNCREANDHRHLSAYMADNEGSEVFGIETEGM
jgi:hypothetical protein